MKDKRNGFTLVEVIIAVAILAVVTVPVVKIFIQTANLDSAARQAQKATDIAQNVIEGIREYSMEEIIDQCMSVTSEKNTLSFLTDWCDGYVPNTTYRPLTNISDENVSFDNESGILEYIKNKYGTNGVWGNAEKEESNSGGSKEIAIDFKGDMIKFAIRGVQYPEGASTYDIIVAFDVNGDTNNHRYELSGDEYYLYTVTVSVYQLVAGTSVKRASLTSAVQNKPNTTIVVTDNKDKYCDCEFILQHNAHGAQVVHINGNDECEIIKNAEIKGNFSKIDVKYDQLIESKYKLCDICFSENE